MIIFSISLDSWTIFTMLIYEYSQVDPLFARIGSSKSSCYTYFLRMNHGLHYPSHSLMILSHSFLKNTSCLETARQQCFPTYACNAFCSAFQLISSKSDLSYFQGSIVFFHLCLWFADTLSAINIHTNPVWVSSQAHFIIDNNQKLLIGVLVAM